MGSSHSHRSSDARFGTGFSVALLFSRLICSCVSNPQFALKQRLYWGGEHRDPPKLPFAGLKPPKTPRGPPWLQGGAMGQVPALAG